MTDLTERGKQLRRDTLTEGRKAGYYHFGGALSCVEILIALYDYLLTPDDVVIVSKGHGWFPQYLILREQGFNPRPYTHPQRDPSNGITCTTGSLGHGLPMAAGMAWAKRLKGDPGIIYCVVGEGCIMEGTFWETLQLATKLRLGNLCVIWDCNRIQGSGSPFSLRADQIQDLMDTLFWRYSEVDGHCVKELRLVLRESVPTDEDIADPHFVTARTVKGRGVSFMEDDPVWHANWPSEEQLMQALEELK